MLIYTPLYMSWRLAVTIQVIMDNVDYSAKGPLDFVVTYCNHYITLELDRVQPRSN